MGSWRQELESEFASAQAARARGNEGQARVCARRAAGIAIREYLARRGQPQRKRSAYDLLNTMKSDPATPPDLQPLLEHLTLRVTEEFRLPVEADLVADARALCRALLGE